MIQVSRSHVKLAGASSYRAPSESNRFANTASSLGSLDISRFDHEKYADPALDRTVDTNVSMPDKDEDPISRANRYEMDAANNISEFEAFGGDAEPATPPPRSRQVELHGPPRSAGAHSTGSASPFNQLADDHSLALSESHETFADLDGSSPSLDPYSHK
jgi:hypothetical protein